MMDFFMPCWKNNNTLATASPRPLRSWLSWLGWLCLWLAWLATPVWAQTNIALLDSQLERAEDGIYLSATLDFELSPALEDALGRGMALNFVLQAEVLRERWYWYDKKLSLAERYYRLAYQPLSRRWRLQVSPTPLVNSGLGVTLGNSYESLSDALLGLQKTTRWKVIEPGLLQKDAKQRLDLRFRLDLSQLPQALQFGSQASSDWNLSLSHSFRLEDLAK
jgi:hypothetical protein